MRVGVLLIFAFYILLFITHSYINTQNLSTEKIKTPQKKSFAFHVPPMHFSGFPSGASTFKTQRPPRTLLAYYSPTQRAKTAIPAATANPPKPAPPNLDTATPDWVADAEAEPELDVAVAAALTRDDEPVLVEVLRELGTVTEPVALIAVALAKPDQPERGTPVPRTTDEEATETASAAVPFLADVEAALVLFVVAVEVESATASFFTETVDAVAVADIDEDDDERPWYAALEMPN